MLEVTCSNVSPWGTRVAMVHSWVAALVKTRSDLGSLSWLSYNLDFLTNAPLAPFLLVSCNLLDSL